MDVAELRSRRAARTARREMQLEKVSADPLAWVGRSNWLVEEMYGCDRTSSTNAETSSPITAGR
jgi:hypothetical protein